MRYYQDPCKGVTNFIDADHCVRINLVNHPLMQGLQVARLSKLKLVS